MKHVNVTIDLKSNNVQGDIRRLIVGNLIVHTHNSKHEEGPNNESTSPLSPSSSLSSPSPSPSSYHHNHNHNHSDHDEQQVTVEELSGGITNKLYKIDVTLENQATTTTTKLLCRVNGLGTEELLDRSRETHHMNELSKFGQGPKVYFTFNNGFVYSFLPGRCLRVDEMPTFAPQIARQMFQFHQMDIDAPDRNESNLFRMTHKWFRDLHELQRGISGDVKQKVEQFQLDTMERELAELERLAKRYDCDIVFCHNDLLAYNIILNEDTQSIHFIDYEYCGYNYRAFDIGNHFCEYGARIDPELYPSVDMQRRFIQYYVEQWTESGEDEASSSPDRMEQLREQLRVEANFFALLVNLAWGTWAIPQALNSTIKYDYWRYGMEKYAWYWAKREQHMREFIDFYEAKQQRQQQQQQQEA